MIIQLFFLMGAAYFVWEKIIMMYYRYYYYTKQGMKCTGFPLPVLCNLIPFAKTLKNKNEYSDCIQVDYLNEVFNGNIPPNVIDFISSKGLIITSDPDFLRDIYVTKAKYMDKYYRVKDIMYILFGESLLFDKASERQVTKRKHLSAAFYKDKMETLLG